MFYTKSDLILILIGIDGAEGEVLGRGDLSLGENVEKGRLSDVGKSDNSTFQIRAQSSQNDDLLFNFLLLWWHRE